MNLAEQAIRGLDVSVVDGVVMVVDGVDTWFCELDAWRDAKGELSTSDIYPGDDGGAEARFTPRGEE